MLWPTDAKIPVCSLFWVAASKEHLPDSFKPIVKYVQCMPIDSNRLMYILVMILKLNALNWKR